MLMQFEMKMCLFDLSKYNIVILSVVISVILSVDVLMTVVPQDEPPQTCCSVQSEEGVPLPAWHQYH